MQIQKRQFPFLLAYRTGVIFCAFFRQAKTAMASFPLPAEEKVLATRLD